MGLVWELLKLEPELRAERQGDLLRDPPDAPADGREGDGQDWPGPAHEGGVADGAREGARSTHGRARARRREASTTTWAMSLTPSRSQFTMCSDPHGVRPVGPGGVAGGPGQPPAPGRARDRALWPVLSNQPLPPAGAAAVFLWSATPGVVLGPGRNPVAPVRGVGCNSSVLRGRGSVAAEPVSLREGSNAGSEREDL